MSTTLSTILVVDDTTLDRETVARLLEYEGFATIRCASGRDAWATLYNTTPDLILLDLMMPDMDGITLLRQVRRSPLWKDMPVIVLTGASDDKKLITQAWELKIRDLIPKASFGFEHLLSQVKKHVGQNGAGRANGAGANSLAGGNGADGNGGALVPATNNPNAPSAGPASERPASRQTWPSARRLDDLDGARANKGSPEGVRKDDKVAR